MCTGPMNYFVNINYQAYYTARLQRFNVMSNQHLHLREGRSQMATSADDAT